MRVSSFLSLFLVASFGHAQHRAVLTVQDIGSVHLIVEAAWSDSTFLIQTRSNADRELLGKRTALLARTFTPHFHEGRVLRIIGRRTGASGDSITHRAVLTSPFGNYHFIATQHGDSLTAQLYNGRMEQRGSFRMDMEAPPPPPTRMTHLLRPALDSARARLYDPALLKTAAWRRFEKRMDGVNTHARDELELVLAFFHHAGKLPFSHFALVRPAPATYQGSTPAFQLSDTTGHTGLLRVRHLGGPASEVDSIFNLILERGYTELIIDLRGVPGGNVEAGLQLAAHVLAQPLEGGYFLTRRWWDTHNAPPTPAQVRALPAFSEADHSAIVAGIHREQGLRLVVHPVAKPYTGRLTLLTDGRTSSTCEPLVHGLKSSGRATVIGERTAGAMLSAEPFPLTSGMLVYVPTADFRTMEGQVIDGTGVKPNIRSKSSKALERALRKR